MVATDLVRLPRASVEGQHLVEDLAADAEELEGGRAEHAGRELLVERGIGGRRADARSGAAAVEAGEDHLVLEAHGRGRRSDRAPGVLLAPPLVHLREPLPGEGIRQVLLQAPVEVADRPVQVHRLGGGGVLPLIELGHRAEHQQVGRGLLSRPVEDLLGGA